MVRRPPPPVPPPEPEPHPAHDEEGEMEDSYGVWADNEFDDDQEMYENFETNTAGEENHDEDDDDYEEPDPEPVMPPQPSVPPRAAARQLPPPPNLVPPPVSRAALSPKASPVPAVKKIPTPIVVEPEDDLMYEAVDSPRTPFEDDGEVYTEVDDESPIIQKGRKLPEIKFGLPPIPSLPKAGARPLPVPNQPKQLAAEPKQQPSVSPQLPRRNVPVPPPMNPVPSTARAPVPTNKRALPQPTLPPPPPELLATEDDDDTYEGGDFYQEKHEFVPQKKPLPRPPAGGSNIPDSDGEDDENYTCVPEEKPNQWKQSANRPVPAVPQIQSTPNKSAPSVPLPRLPPSKSPTPGQSSESTSRFPIEKFQMELARISQKKTKNDDDADTRMDPEPDTDDTQAADDDDTSTLSTNSLLSAKNRLKPVNPVNRWESLNTPEKPKVSVSVKRAESENVRPNAEKKLNPLSELKSKLESRETGLGKPNMKLTPMFPDKKAEPREEMGGNRGFPPPPVQRAVLDIPTTNRRPSAPNVETGNRFQPPVIPPGRSGGRNIKEASSLSNSDNDLSNSFDSSCAISNRRLPAPPQKETRAPPPAAEVAEPKPRGRALPQPANSLEGLYSFAWYFSEIERSDAEKKILDMKKDGSFLVRKSKRGGDSNPYTLTIMNSGLIYNLHIRRRKDQKYALGTEKPDETVFANVEDLITFHRNNPIEVVGDARKNVGPGKVILQASPRK